MQEINLKFCPSWKFESLARVISQAFLRSHNFAGIDENRYSPEKIHLTLRAGIPIAAYQQNEIIGGVCIFKPSPTSPCKHFHNLWQIGLLGVSPESSGQAVGTKLMNMAEATISIAGGKSVVLSVTSRADDLIRYYLAREYKQIEEHHWEGVRDPSAILVKQLL